MTRVFHCAAALVLALSVIPAGLSAQAADTPPADKPPVTLHPDSADRMRLVTRNDLLYAGGFVAGTVLVSQLDTRVARDLQDTAQLPSLFTRRATRAFNTAGVPGAFIAAGGMYLVGRAAGVRGLADAGLHTMEAVILAEAATYVIKVGFGRERPSSAGADSDHFSFGRGLKGNRFSSFPSGHASGAFAAAAALTAEASSRWPRSTIFVAPILYGGAAMVGWARLQSNAHWLSDVFLGAGLGTIAGIKVVRYNHKHPGNRLDQFLLGATPAVTPYLNGQGVLLTWTLRPRFLSASF